LQSIHRSKLTYTILNAIMLALLLLIACAAATQVVGLPAVIGEAGVTSGLTTHAQTLPHLHENLESSSRSDDARWQAVAANASAMTKEAMLKMQVQVNDEGVMDATATGGAASAGTGSDSEGRGSGGRSLQAKKFFFRSWQNLNPPVKYPKGAKYTLPNQKVLPDTYVPGSKSSVKFSQAQQKYRPHRFKIARGSYYGIDPSKGDSIDIGSCGFGHIGKGEACGNNCLDITALSDTNPRYPRSCGRCYEIGCVKSTFTDGYGQIMDRSKDCIDPDATLVVRVTDTCPCVYPNNAYSNKRWCCGDTNDLPHFDMSVQAFEKLAPLAVGVIGLRHREVPCWYQPPKIAKRPSKYTKPNPIPSGQKNRGRGWNWLADVANWVTVQRHYPLSAGAVRTPKPANVTGAGVTGFVPP